VGGAYSVVEAEQGARLSHSLPPLWPWRIRPRAHRVVGRIFRIPIVWLWRRGKALVVPYSLLPALLSWSWSLRPCPPLRRAWFCSFLVVCECRMRYRRVIRSKLSCWRHTRRKMDLLNLNSLCRSAMAFRCSNSLDGGLKASCEMR